MYEVYSKNLVL